MPSIVPGFQYDIFISYRHKDNQSGPGHENEGWVTQFVEHLKRELDATFKEDISIYFDVNPHDGLRESHHVSKSLEGKLKALIFIPVISQTYCDVKSFAWQNEFCEFNKLANADLIGRDIRLGNGNVASRILPVKIHDLDSEDELLLENELSGVLRAVEFIYRSHGVNRPLTPADNPDKNLNRTFYRDQINKVAHSIKEIISSLKESSTIHSQTDPPVNVSGQPSEKQQLWSRSKRNGSVSRKWLIPAAVLLGIFGLAMYWQFERSPRFTGAEKSIAVLPFENIGSDQDNEFISDGITSEIISHLSKISGLQSVTGWSSARLYKKTTKSVSVIGQELGVASILTGTIQKEGEHLRVIAELIDVNTSKQIWGGTYNRDWDDVLKLQSELSQIIAANLNTELSEDEIRRVESKATNNPSAYEDFLKGKNSFYGEYVNQTKFEATVREAEGHFKRAIEKDSTFALAWSMLGATYSQVALTFDSVDRFQYHHRALVAGIKGVTLGPELSETNMYMADILKSVTLNPFTSLHFLRRAIELNPNNAEAYYLLGWLYMEMGEMDHAKTTFTKAERLNPGPRLTSAWFFYFIFSGNVNKLKTFTKDFNISPGDYLYMRCRMNICLLENRYDSVLILAQQLHYPNLVGIAHAKLGQTAMANREVDTLEDESKDNWFGTTSFAPYNNTHTDICVIYAAMGETAKALDHLELAYRFRERSLLGIRYNNLFDPLRNEERFKSLVKRLSGEF